eukprot:gene3422-3912_t
MQCSPYPEFVSIDGEYVVLPITMISAIIALIGNVLVLTVIIKHEALRSQPAYRFIASLSIADILVSVLAQPLYVAVLLSGGSNCWVKRTGHFFGTISSSASALAVLIVSIDRLILITKPLQYQRIMTSLRVKAGLAYIWCTAVLISLTPYIVSIKTFHTIVLSATIFNYVCTIYCYLTIFRVVRKKVSNDVITLQNTSRRQHQATRTVAFVLLAMVVCWLPYVLCSFVWALNKNKWTKDATITSLYFWLLALGHWNSSVNVFIYSWKNKELRTAMKRCVGMRNSEQMSWAMPENRTTDATAKNTQDTNIRIISVE